MEFNLLKIGFVLMTFFMVIVGSLINTVERLLPPFVVQTFRYGKCAYQGSNSFFIKPLEVPKRWFRHFYVFAAIFTTLATVIVIKLYCFGSKIDPWLLKCFDILVPDRRATVSTESTLLALCLLTIQSWHRFYETWFVSIFSDAKMNVIHYFVGYIHYFGSVAAILAESHGFISSDEKMANLSLDDLNVMNILASIIFLWACYHQCKIAFILANLRKNKKGEVVTVKHTIPHGHWFEFVSSPHLLTEVLMYFCLTLILWGAEIWPWIFLWVLSNQVESALLTHWWYQNNFSNYPEKRKAILPYVL